MPVIAFTNLKGGVAKTTTAVAVAESMALAGHRTLLIDADHQCMASELLLGEKRLLDSDYSKQTLHDLLREMLKSEFDPDRFANYVQHEASTIDFGLENLSVLPCSIRIDDFHTNMAKSGLGDYSMSKINNFFARRRPAFKRWLTSNYDFTIIDCPPSMAIQVKFLLSLADSFIVPCVPDRLSVRGSNYLMKKLKSTQRKIRPLGTVWSLYRKQSSLHNRTIRGNAPLFETLPRPFKTIIPNSTAIAESTEPDFLPKAYSEKYSLTFSRIFHSLTEEIIHRSEEVIVERQLELSASH